MRQPQRLWLSLQDDIIENNDDLQAYVSRFGTGLPSELLRLIARLDHSIEIGTHGEIRRRASRGQTL